MNSPTPTGWARTAYGIDENGGHPIIVKAVRRGRSLSFSNADAKEATIPAPRTVLAACFFQRESFTRWLTAPIASARKAATVFHSLLDVQLPFSVEDCEVALLGTMPTDDRTGTRGLVAGARREDIERKLAGLALAGMDPHLLDQESIALWHQGLSEYPPVRDEASPRVMIYLGSDRITLVAGQSAVFLGALSLRQPEIESIHRFLKSHFPTALTAIQFFWTGPGATRDTAESLYASLATRWPGSTKIVREPETFLARALAGRALIPGPTSCNLRSGRHLHPELARRQERLPTLWGRACLAAGLLLCLVNIVWLVSTQHRITETQALLKTLAGEVTGSPRGLPAGQEVLAARRIMEQQTQTMEPFLAAVDVPLRDTLKTILALATEEGLTLETLTLSRKNGVIHGLVPKFEQGSKLAQGLNGTGWTTSIERKVQPQGEERPAFVIGMERRREKK
ncbi:MAG: hypothetical protein WCL49_06850 [bacterium]